MSMDGVSESKSSTISLDVYSIKFNGCREVYPVKIVRPINKYPIDNLTQFSSVLNAVLQLNLILHALIADAPKRAFARFCMMYSGRYSCEYCFESGVPFSSTTTNDEIVEKIKQQKIEISNQIQHLSEDEDQVQIEILNNILNNLDQALKLANRKKGSHIVWPANTMNGEIRTKEKVLEIVEKIESGEDLTANEKRGIKGRSILLNIDYFDFVCAIPTEYMHLLALGVIKRLLELTFSVGESRTRITKRPLLSPEVFNVIMKKIKVVKEFPRRARQLDLSVMKAQELRNVIIFYFPIVTKCLVGWDKEIKMWEMLAFMIRACILPEVEYENVNTNQIKYCQKNFYIIYQSLFGEKNCTYSIHILAAHLLIMRSMGPLTETSAFRFENFYAELRRSFHPGSVSVLKQMLQTVLLKRVLCNHVCEEKMYFSEKDTQLECNSLIYVYENDTHVIYQINSIDDNDLICNQLGNHTIDLPHTNMLNWSTVGVYRKGGLSSTNVKISRDQVDGKVIRVENYLLTCPVNILREK